MIATSAIFRISLVFLRIELMSFAGHTPVRLVGRADVIQAGLRPSLNAAAFNSLAFDCFECVSLHSTIAVESGIEKSAAKSI